MIIDQIVKNWQHYFEMRDVGRGRAGPRHGLKYGKGPGFRCHGSGWARLRIGYEDEQAGPDYVRILGPIQGFTRYQYTATFVYILQLMMHPTDVLWYFTCDARMTHLVKTINFGIHRPKNITRKNLHHRYSYIVCGTLPAIFWLISTHIGLLILIKIAILSAASIKDNGERITIP